MTSVQEPEILIKTINLKTIVFSYDISHIGIRTRIINLEKNAIFDILFYDANDNIVKTEVLMLTQEEYNNWGIDDNYIMNLIAQRYNVEIQ